MVKIEEKPLYCCRIVHECMTIIWETAANRQSNAGIVFVLKFTKYVLIIT